MWTVTTFDGKTSTAAEFFAIIRLVQPAPEQPPTPSQSVLPRPADPAEYSDIVWQQLEATFTWYNTAANRTRYGYQITRLAALLLGSTVTVLAAISAPAAVTASLAAAGVAAEGIQQLYQFHANWISYRATSEALRREALSYAAKVEPYNDPATRRLKLAQTVRDLSAKENASWSSTMNQPPGTLKGPA
jgi:hypothetical protein